MCFFLHSFSTSHNFVNQCSFNHFSVPSAICCGSEFAWIFPQSVDMQANRICVNGRSTGDSQSHLGRWRSLDCFSWWVLSVWKLSVRRFKLSELEDSLPVARHECCAWKTEQCLAGGRRHFWRDTRTIFNLSTQNAITFSQIEKKKLKEFAGHFFFHSLIEPSLKCHLSRGVIERIHPSLANDLTFLVSATTS